MTAFRLGSRTRLGLSSRSRHGPPATPFSPATIPGLAFWYDAATSPTVEAGGVIEQWQDLSGQGNHASQVAGASRPKRALDGTGREVVRFDGIDDALLIDTPPDVASGVTVFVAFRMRARADFSGILAAGGATGTDDADFFAFANASAASREVQLTARSNEADPLLLSGVDSTGIQFAVFTISAADGTLRDLNGEASDPSTAVALGTPTALALGARLLDGNPANSAAIDLFEVGLYAGALPADDRDRLETYLRSRHGLAWDPLHFGVDLAWFHDVGRSDLTLTGDAVDRWSDLSTSGLDWLQTGAARPLLTTDSLGRDTVRFDGVDDTLLLTGPSPALEPFTTAIVLAVRTPGDFAGILSAAPASGTDVAEFWSFQTIEGEPAQVSLQGRALEADPLALTVDDANVAHLAFWTVANGSAELITSVQTAADSYDGSFGTPAEIVLGGRFDGSPFGYAAIDVYATLGISHVLTAAERQRLADWASVRWGL